MEVNKEVLPKGWAIAKFNECCENISLNGIKIKQKQYLASGKFPVIDQGRELIGGYFNDDLLVVPNEPPFIIFGDHTKVKKYVTFKFIAGADGVKVLKPYGFILPKLFYYFIHAVKMPDKGYARHYQFLAGEKFPIPPLPEQTRILAKLEHLLTDLDKGIEYLETTKQQLKVYRQAVLKWAFEGCLNCDSSDDDDKHDLTNKNKKNQGNHTNQKNQGSDKGELPVGWIWKTIEEVADVTTGVTPLRTNKSYWDKGTIPWITSGALNDEFVSKSEEFVTEKAFEETTLKLLPKHTLLLALYGEGKTRGKCSELLFESTTNQAVAGIKMKEEFVENRKFLKWFLLKNYQDIRLLSAGGVQPNLNSTIIKKTRFPFPSLKEQNKIIQEIESRLSVCDKIEESIESSLQQAEALRLSIIKKAFEGKLVPQDPNDEPAEKLLERIRKEKESIKNQPVNLKNLNSKVKTRNLNKKSTI